MSESYIFNTLKAGRALYKSQAKGLVAVQHLACCQWWGLACAYNVESLKSMKFGHFFLRMVHERPS